MHLHPVDRTNEVGQRTQTKTGRGQERKPDAVRRVDIRAFFRQRRHPMSKEELLQAEQQGDEKGENSLSYVHNVCSQQR